MADERPTRRERRAERTERSARPGRQRIGGGAPTSAARTGVAALLVLLGIAWLVVFTVVVGGPDGADGGDALAWMADLGRWNYVIGFVLVYVGLAAAAHPSTPLGRGRGVVVGMLGCFLLGLVWIVAYYVLGQTVDVPLLSDLAQYNLVVGIGFMAVGFVYATHWE